MKIAKLVIGIISMVLSIFILFQSCAAGLVNTFEGSGGVSGTAGVIVAACFIIAGIVGVVTRNSYRAGGGLSAAGFYLVAALFGGTMAGNYSDLYIWAFLSWAFAIFYLVDAFYDEDDWEEVRWWQKSWLIILATIIFPPVGIALLWFSRQFIVIPKVIMTVIFSLGFIVILANLGGLLTSAPGAASTTADDTTTPSTTTEEPEKTTEPQKKVYGLGETWTVDGLFDLTFTAASLTDDRNQFTDKAPAQVVILTYDYSNIGVEKSIMELYVSSSSFKVIDGSGVMADSYPASTSGNPKETPIGAKTVGAQVAYGLANASGEITVNVGVRGNDFKSYDAVFKLPVN